MKINERFQIKFNLSEIKSLYVIEYKLIQIHYNLSKIYALNIYEENKSIRVPLFCTNTKIILEYRRKKIKGRYKYL